MALILHIFVFATPKKFSFGPKCDDAIELRVALMKSDDGRDI
jgi:hypothetical protein